MQRPVAQRKIAYNQFISKIAVKGYKSLAEKSEIELAPLNILAGVNSSGKSSIMQPLLLLKQTMFASMDPGPFYLSGPNVSFTSADQILSRQSKGKKSKDLEISIERGLVKSQFRESYTFKFTADGAGGFELTQISIHSAKHGTATLRTDMSNDELKDFLPELTHIVQSKKPDIERDEKSNVISEGWKVEREGCFLKACYNFKLQNGKDVQGLFWTGGWDIREKKIISDVIHVPCSRVKSERYHETAALNPSYPGLFQLYVASIVHDWQNTGDDRFELLNKNLEVLMNFRSLKSKRINGTQIELYINRIPAGSKKLPADHINIADAGFGLSQVLSILVALLAAEEGQLVYIEEPELHLHPKAQSAMAGILAEAVKRGIRVVAETHSTLLLLGIQTLVAEGKLKHDQVKLHWFKRGRDGLTRITSTGLDENGAFDKDWPEDFSEVELKADTRFLDAVSKRRK